MEYANAEIMTKLIKAGNEWFSAKKTAECWIKPIKEDMQIETLEGPVEAKAGNFLCKGPAGELWPQSGEDIKAKYVSTEGFDEEGFCLYVSRPDTPTVYVTKVNFDFEVVTSWGTLTGKPGDYIVKTEDVDFPQDCWIVEEEIFENTYKINVVESIL